MRVLVTGAGGSIGIDVCRSLSDTAGVELIGAEANPWGARLARRFCAHVVPLPRADQVAPEAFRRALERHVKRLGVDFLWVNPDPELQAVARCGWRPPCAHALPGARMLPICLDKEATGRQLQAAQLAPDTRALRVGLSARADGPGTETPPTDVALLARSLLPQVERAFAHLGVPLWVRPGSGAGGIGSLRADHPQEAAFWIALWSARRAATDWVLQEYLPGRNFNCTLLYARGTLCAWAAMERLGYFLAEAAPSGITGQVKLCRTVAEEQVLQAARRAVELLDPRPHGVYSVDLREDVQGCPRVTEINPRLAGRPWLYTQAGCNLPELALRWLTPPPAEPPEAVRSPRPGWTLYRQLDCEPTVLPPGESSHEYTNALAGNPTAT